MWNLNIKKKKKKSKNSTHFSNKIIFIKSNSKLRKYMEELPLICIQCLVNFMFLDSSKKFLEERGDLETIKLRKATKGCVFLQSLTKYS